MGLAGALVDCVAISSRVHVARALPAQTQLHSTLLRVVQSRTTPSPGRTPPPPSTRATHPTMYETHADHHEEQFEEPVSHIEHEREEIFEAVTPLVVVADLPTPSAETDEPTADEMEADEAEETAEPEQNGHHAAATAESTHGATTNGIDSHPIVVPTGPSATAAHLTPPVSISAPAAAEARGLLEGIAESLRTLAGRQGADGTAVAIFPRGVDLLEVRMHVARDQAIDLNFRVAGPAQPALTA